MRLERQFGHPRQHEQHHAHRRMQQADHQVQHHRRGRSAPGRCRAAAPTGISTGTRIRIAAVGSRKQPTNSISRLASSRNTHGVCVKREHPRRDHVGHARRGEQPAEDRRRGDDEQHGRRRLDRVHRDLDQHPPASACGTRTRPRNSAQTHAAIAPSVGVNTPVVMPPISSTGVMIGSTASNFHFQSAANSADQRRRRSRR